jgi:putative hemolysin
VNWMEAVFWFGLAFAGLLIAGLGAGLETGIYSLNRVRLQVSHHQGTASASILVHHLAAPAALISTLLIFHNVGVKLATHAAAILLSSQELSEWQIVLFDAVIMMPLLFAFAETVPKDLFSVHADKFMHVFARPMSFLVVICRAVGLLTLMTGLSAALAAVLGIRAPKRAFHPRGQIDALVSEGVGHGLLSDEQLAIVQRVLALGTRSAADVMTPWDQVLKVRTDDSPQTLRDMASRSARSRFPVLDEKDRVVGVLNIYDVLVHEAEQCPAVPRLMAPPQTVQADASLRATLSHLQLRHAALALVTDEQQAPLGIVSIKDLIEPITGELAQW